MTDKTDSEKIAKLEQQVTVLTILVIVALLLSTILFLTSGRFVADGSRELEGSEFTTGTREEDSAGVGPSFPDDDPMEAINASNAIVLAEHEKRGSELQAVIREILWISPETEFRYAVGDDIGHSIEIKPNRRHGDSLVIFFEGKPARFSRSCSVYGDRILSFDEMKVSEFRKLVEDAVVERE